MISFETLSLFFITTLVVVLSPGPAALSVTAEAASNGFKRSLFIIFGVASANVVYFILSALGIAALLIASNVLFSIIKWIGVAYLLYLGGTALFSSSGAFNIQRNNKKTGYLHRVFLKGFILEISNPKALLYFSALLPQFIDTSLPIIPQFIIFALITLFLDLFCYSLYAYLGWKSINAGLKPMLVTIINKTAGSMLIIAGIKMASVER